MTLFDQGGLPELVDASETVGTTKVFEGAKYDRLSLKNNAFGMRLKSGETEVAPEDSGSLHAVIVHTSEDVHRLFWKERWKKDQPAKPPSCYSSNGRLPDESVKAEDKQSDNCTFCPNNKDGSGPDGVGKACKFSMPTVLVFVDPQEQQLTAEVPVQFPVNGPSIFGDSDPDKHLYALRAYTRELAVKIKARAEQVITRISFDRSPDATPCKVHFSPAEALTPELNSAIKQMIEEGDYDLDDMVAISIAAANDIEETDADAPAPEPASRKKSAAKKTTSKKPAAKKEPTPEPEEELEVEPEAEEETEEETEEDTGETSLGEMDFDID